MTPENLCILRKTAGRVGAVFCILIAIVLLDSLISRFVYEFNVFYTQVDGQYDLIGVMPEKSEKMEDLVAESDSPEVVLEFSEVFSGFWLGNTMWRGKVRVFAKAMPGEYVIKVRDAKDTKINPALVFLAKVYPDAQSLRKSHGPYLERYYGITAGWAASILFPGLAIIMLFNYGVSSRLEKALANTGQAEVYMVKRAPEGIQIAFSLGKRQGLKSGEQLDILNSHGSAVGEAAVLTPGDTDSIAAVITALDFGQISSVRRRPI
ncbi:MAG: hypothetical protein HY881_00440 [Deltaproteobacteria bacterium]|nr:hypothetical protein [Deltaproteobacteria bacterium]